MQQKEIFSLMVISGLLMTLASGFWLATATPSNAQCGSQASSCKNCHEVQGEMPVNSDGTAWHTSHAFGDFCYICHAGNNQAKEKTEAHTGMVHPLSDLKASCQQCHPDDLQERGQVYASVLGFDLNASAPAPASETPAGNTAQNEAEVAAAPAAASAPPSTELDLDDPNIVDYTQRYEEIVLGKRPINWGNAILLGLIVLVLLGGGGLVITHEKWVKVSIGDTKSASGEYPADAVEMLPTISTLRPRSRKALKKILDSPQKAEKLLTLMDAVVSDEQAGFSDDQNEEQS